MSLDASGSYAATVCSDKCVYIIDANTGECAAILTGQSEAVSSVAFTPDCRLVMKMIYGKTYNIGEKLCKYVMYLNDTFSSKNKLI